MTMSELSSPTAQAEWAQARADVYAFLARLFTQPPTEELLASLAGEGDSDPLTTIFGPGEGVVLMERALADGINEALLRMLKLEFDALFLVPGRRYTTPYESVYRGGRTGEGLVRGEATAAVQRFYARAGADVSSDFRELPDYIGLELEFMHHLCAREASAWERDEADAARQWAAMEQAFLQDHLAQWVDDFSARLAANARSDFYRGLAELMPVFVHRDLETIEASDVMVT